MERYIKREEKEEEDEGIDEETNDEMEEEDSAWSKVLSMDQEWKLQHTEKGKMEPVPPSHHLSLHLFLHLFQAKW